MHNGWRDCLYCDGHVQWNRIYGYPDRGYSGDRA
ncbi:MAG: hypothetical protein LIO49_00445 [Ruminococcus sp.]|nr:hypothetical protein [Ruminococcus sp.]